MKFQLWINSCLHIAFCAGLLSYASASFLDVESPLKFGLFAFFGTWCVYVSQRIFKGKKLGLTAVHEHIVNHKKSYVIVAVICGLISAGIASLSGLITLLIASFAFIVSVAYVYFPGRKKSLRSSPISKILLVALVWTIVTLLLPVNPFYSEMDLNQVWMLAIERFLFIVMITIPFDIRDMLRDGPNEKTLPILLGESKTRALIALLFVAIGALVYQQWALFLYSDLEALTISSVYVLAFVLSLLAKTKYPEQYFTLGIDSTILLLGLALLSESFL